jgi:hypothetical protein
MPRRPRDGSPRGLAKRLSCAAFGRANVALAGGVGNLCNKHSKNNQVWNKHSKWPDGLDGAGLQTTATGVERNRTKALSREWVADRLGALREGRTGRWRVN